MGFYWQKWSIGFGAWTELSWLIGSWMRMMQKPFFRQQPLDIVTRRLQASRKYEDEYAVRKERAELYLAVVGSFRVECVWWA